MSQMKKLKSFILAILSLFAFFAFGCKDSVVAVDNINIQLESQTQIVLLVDEFFNIGERVEVSPSYATDKSFSIYSMNENVVRVLGNQIKAISEGEAIIRIVANSNDKVEDVISVRVVGTPNKLDTPTSFEYNKETQSFTFNPVANASSYTIEINQREFNIGNINEFSLSNYVGERYNTILSARVKANTNSFGKAYVNSDYSEIVKIYQAEKINDLQIVGGKIKFSTNSDLNYDIYFDENLFMGKQASDEINLNSLDKSYAGATIKVKVIANIAESKKVNGVTYCSSTSNEVILNVVDEPEIAMIGTSISWDAIPFADGYFVKVQGFDEVYCKENYLDLKDLSFYNSIGSDEISVTVSTAISTSGNLAKTTKESNQVKFLRLQQPTISVLESGNGVKWEEVDNASAYLVKVKNGSNEVFAASTNATVLDLSKYGDGNYSVEVYAIGHSGVVNYLSSKVSSMAINKYSQVEASISNYILTIQTVPNAEYLIKYSNKLSETIKASGTSWTKNLAEFNFDAGLNNIEITRLKLESESNTINGVKKVVSFTQLEAVTINVNNSIASVQRSETNRHAEIVMEIAGGSLSENMIIEADSHEFNTSNDSDENFLTAGVYTIVAYVKGDGSSTFSYGSVNADGEKVAIPCGGTGVTVLDIPTLVVNDYSKAEVAVTSVNLAEKYEILDKNNVSLDNDIEESYAFTLNSGAEVELKVRAIGDGKETLNSKCSSLIKIKRLHTPTLNFNADNNSFTYVANNANTLYRENELKFYHNNALVNSYTFNNTFTNLAIGDNTFKLNLKSAGYNAAQETHFIDSFAGEIKVKKLSNALSARVENNNLIIENPENGELLLTIDGVEYTVEQLNAAGLICTKLASNAYSIKLINADANAALDALKDGFKIKVKFIKTGFSAGIYYTSSDYSVESSELQLTKLAAATKIYTDSNNKIIVENPNSSESLFMDLTINGVKYRDNGVVLSDGTTELSYTYLSNKYYIDVYEGSNIKIPGIAQDISFTVTAQFRKTAAGSDVDSAESLPKSIKYLQAPKFNREGQNIYFETVSGYDLTYYMLVVNGTDKVSMSTIDKFSLNDAKYTISMIDLWNELGLVATSVNTLAIQVLNLATTEDYPLLGSLSDEIKVQQISSFTLSTVKEGGKTYLKFTSLNADFEITHVIDVIGERITTRDGSEIKIELDSKNFTGSFSINGFVETDKQDGEIYMFNSVESNSVTVSKLATPTLTVNNNEIIVSGASNYEVYENVDGTPSKVDNSILVKNGNKFMLNNLAANATRIILVKSVSEDANIVNSSFSDLINIIKLNNATASVNEGEVQITLPTGWDEAVQNGVSAVLSLNLAGNQYNCTISYSDDTFVTDVPGITYLEANTFKVDSSLIFKYAENFIVEKEIKVQLKLNGFYNEKFYMYSDESTQNVKGLFKPINLAIEKDGDYANNIIWTNNSKNKLSEAGSLLPISKYDVEISYLGQVYLIEINANRVAFPKGYDSNNDGDFDDEGDVKFVAGEYYIRIKAYADGYATSPYSDVYKFTIMETVDTEISGGQLTWDKITNATSYIVRISSMNIGTGTLSDEKVYVLGDVDSYDLESFDGYNNLYSVTVQAVTTNANFLNAEQSSPILFYRLGQPENVSVDDGVLVVQATKFAKYIRVEFNGNSYDFENVNYDTYLNSAGLFDFISPTNVTYRLDLAKVDPEFNGTANEVKVKLIGDTGTKLIFDYDIGLASAKTKTLSKTAQVLKTNINQVESGIWTFNQNTELGETTNKTKLNYNFNNVDVANIHTFWLNTIIYSIEIETTGQGEPKYNKIYAVDYTRFAEAVAAGSLLEDADGSLIADENGPQTVYKLIYDQNGLYAKIIYKNTDGSFLYFNVYRDNVKDASGTPVQTGNVVNLQDYDNLYYYQINYNTETHTYSSLEAIQSVNLAAGGSFVLNIRTLGGDEQTNNIYFNSKSEALAPFVRFGQSIISTNAGLVVFDDLKIDTTIPVYKITIEKIGGGTSICYLYDIKYKDNEADIRIKFADGNIYEAYEIDATSKKVKFDMGKYFDTGVYSVSVRAMAGIDADDFILNAKHPEGLSKDVKIFSAPSGVVVDRTITFDKSTVVIDGHPTYATAYEIVITKEGETDEYVAQISDSDCVINSNTILYYLPNTIDGQAIVSGTKYNFKIRATTEAEYYLNSKYSENKNFIREISVAGQKIENGILKWTGSNDTASYLIKIVDNTNGNVLKIETNQSSEECSYNFNQATYPLFNMAGSAGILAGNNYTINISKVGITNVVQSLYMINSPYVVVTGVERLQNVVGSSFIGSDGVLLWDAVENANGYYVEIGTHKYTVESDVTSIDLSTYKDDDNKLLEAGTYSAKIMALGSNKLNSLAINSGANFTKLATVSNIKLENNSIVWDAVENAVRYRVSFEYTNTAGAAGDYVAYTSTNTISLPGDVSGFLTAYITACPEDGINSTDETKYRLNSNIVEWKTATKAPNSVQGLHFETGLNRFEWSMFKVSGVEDFVDTDKLKITYEFNRYSSGGNVVEEIQPLELTYQQVKDNYYDAEKDCYYFDINIMGEYTNFQVFVLREGQAVGSSLASATLNWFKYGSGTESDAYAIETVDHLRNMHYYPTAYYKLISDITISNTTIEGGNASICKFDFAGKFDGENKKINITLTNLENVKEFALFNSLTNAKISNLNISGNITNRISSTITGNVKIAILALNATNSEFSNVGIITSNISILETVETDAKEIEGDMYVAGFIATDNGSKFEQCKIVGEGQNVGLTLDLDIDVLANEYVGGIAANAINTNVNAGIFNVCIKNGESQLQYVGGLFGVVKGRVSGTGDYATYPDAITGATITISITEVNALYIGGVAGYVVNMTLENNTVNGSIKYNEIAKTIYIGGVAGYVESSSLINNSVTSATMSLKITGANGDKMLGLIAGCLAVSSGNKCEVKGSYVGIDDSTTIAYNTILTLGICGSGNLVSGVTIVKNLSV